MDQRSAALAIVRHIRDKLDKGAVFRLHRDLEKLVGRSQNRPPDGEADGSIDERLWCKLRDLSKSLREVIQALDMYPIKDPDRQI